MTPSPRASHRLPHVTSLTTPVVDFEPAPVGPAGACPPPSSASLRRRTPRTSRARPQPRETPPPTGAVVFADTALRRLLEVIDRRRPITQLRAALAPALIDGVIALTRRPSGDATAVLRRVRLRTAAHDGGEPVAAEVFATYSRGPRIRAIAGRIELNTAAGRWQLVALQVG